jgi:hypothetical protein
MDNPAIEKTEEKLDHLERFSVELLKAHPDWFPDNVPSGYGKPVMRMSFENGRRRGLRVSIHMGEKWNYVRSIVLLAPDEADGQKSFIFGLVRISGVDGRGIIERAIAGEELPTNNIYGVAASIYNTARFCSTHGEVSRDDIKRLMAVAGNAGNTPSAVPCEEFADIWRRSTPPRPRLLQRILGRGTPKIDLLTWEGFPTIV